MDSYSEVKSAPPIYSVADALLDSNLITQTNKQLYNTKLINCGNNYIQLYIYDENRIRNNNNLESNSRVKEKEIKIKKEPELKEIREDNILRSKLSLERLIKSNMQYFASFITLTFEKNISDIKEANKYFNIWRTRIKKSCEEFKYICVPEYQKRGAVHFHLLTNLELNTNIIYKQKNKNNMYDIKYWNNGFSSAFKINERDINVIYYLSKYLTKNIDNRLYGHRRYFYSKNLKIPIIEFLNCKDFKSLNHLNILLDSKFLIYEKKYYSKYNNLTEIHFKEYKNKRDFDYNTFKVHTK